MIYIYKENEWKILLKLLPNGKFKTIGGLNDHSRKYAKDHRNEERFWSRVQKYSSYSNFISFSPLNSPEVFDAEEKS